MNSALPVQRWREYYLPPQIQTNTSTVQQSMQCGIKGTVLGTANQIDAALITGPLDQQIRDAINFTKRNTRVAARKIQGEWRYRSLVQELYLRRL